MEEVPIQVVRLAPDGSYELDDYHWNRPGRHDYKSEGFSVERIEGADGVERHPRWEDEPIEILPGCVATRRDGRRCLRIWSRACPVRVLYTHWFQYTGSHHDHSYGWRTPTWYHFELDEGEDGAIEG